MASLVIVNGDEDFLMERAVRDEISASLLQEVLEFRLPGGLDDYLYESSLPAFGNGARAFVVWDAQDVPELPHGSGDLLVCVAKSAKKPLSDPRARRIHAFPKMKSYSDNNEVLRWILKEGERLNIDLSRIAPALFVNCGNSLRKISSEIQKIAVLVSPGSVASPDAVRGLMCFSADLNPQQIVDAICEGHPTKALAFYDKMQEGSDETGWIIAYLQRHVLQSLRIELMLDAGAKESEIAESLGVHPFIMRKMLSSRRGLWTKASLVSGINTLCELDLAHKKGDASSRFGLELEIIRLSEEAKNVKR